jgi:hypothetical protein
MRKQLNRRFAAFLTITFALVISLVSVHETSAQRYLTEIRDSADIKGVAQFADNLSQFLTLAEKAEADSRLNPILLKQLEAAAKKVKDGTSNLRSSLKGLVGNFKTKDQWNEALDNQFNELLSNRKVKGFFQRNGARKVLTDIDAAINAINSDVDSIMVIAVKKGVSASVGSSIFFQTSFASTAPAAKVRFKCVVLGVAIFGAELVKASRTAENLDGFFDKSCGAGANTAT